VLQREIQGQHREEEDAEIALVHSAGSNASSRQRYRCHMSCSTMKMGPAARLARKGDPIEEGNRFSSPARSTADSSGRSDNGMR
jgi:hypothetical protein